LNEIQSVFEDAKVYELHNKTATINNPKCMSCLIKHISYKTWARGGKLAQLFQFGFKCTWLPAMNWEKLISYEISND